MKFSDWYLSPIALICFDGEGGDGGEGGDDGGEAGAGGEGAKLFSDPAQQAKFNKALAEDRRKHASEAAKFKTQLEKTQTQLNEILQSKNLSDEQREKAEQAREDIRRQLLSKDEAAREEKEKLRNDYEARLSTAEKKAVEWESKYNESTITRALQDAAVEEDAFNPSVLVTVLRGDAKINAEGNVVVESPRVHEDGSMEVLQMSPKEAIKKMKDQPEKYGGLFRSNVVSGVGGSSGGGSNSGLKNGKIDLKKLLSTPEGRAEYQRLRKEDPAKLGL